MRISDWSSDVCSSDLRVAADEDVAVDIGRDRGHADDVAGIVHREVEKLDLVLERLVEQQILLAFLEGHLRAGGRELVGVEIITLLPVEAVGGDFLVQDPRGDRESLGGLPAHRPAAALPSPPLAAPALPPPLPPPAL